MTVDELEKKRKKLGGSTVTAKYMLPELTDELRKQVFPSWWQKLKTAVLPK